jgi:hypothetical protein
MATATFRTRTAILAGREPLLGAEPTPAYLLHLSEASSASRRGPRMTGEPSLRDEMLAALPSLRACALSLSNDPIQADDLVQETILRLGPTATGSKPAPICTLGSSRSCAISSCLNTGSAGGRSRTWTGPMLGR